MTKLGQLLWNNDTPMDAAERAAIRKLVEIDCDGGTEFDPYNPNISPSGFPIIDPSLMAGSKQKSVWL
jgi:hypothetical protein